MQVQLQKCILIIALGMANDSASGRERESHECFMNWSRTTSTYIGDKIDGYLQK